MMLRLSSPSLLFIALMLLSCATTQAAEQNSQSNTEQRIDQGLDWDSCAPSGQYKPIATIRPPVQPEVIYLEADDALLDQTRQQLYLTGDARVRKDATYLEADELTYHQRERSADLLGAIYLEQPGLRVTGDAGWLALDSNQGWLSAAEYRLPEINARGTATRAEMLSESRFLYTQVSYTTCPPDSQDWRLNASDMQIDREAGWGRAHHAVLRLGGLPVFYTPYLSFPVDDRRKSGLLFPSFGSSERLGSEFSIPYYLNLAPNYDATLTPRWMSKRGIMLGGELRFLTEKQRGILRGEILDDEVESSERDNQRSAIKLTHQSQPLQGLSTRIDASHVSDLDYLSDFGDGLAITSTRYLEQTAEAVYRTGDWRLTGRVQDFQSVDRSIGPASLPYKQMPQLQASYRHAFSESNTDLGLESEYVHFRHDTNVTGKRLRLAPAVSLPLRRSWGHLTPRLTFNYATYELDDPSTEKPRPGYFVPTLSLDTGLVFERDSHWFSADATQTLEPRLYALYAPFEDQSDIPDFDTALLDISYANLFKENRFSGGDRVGDARQVTLGLTSRWLERDTGIERIRASIGRIFYFQDRQVRLTGEPEDVPSSPIAAELSSRLGQYWRSSLTLRWDPNLDEEQFDRGQFGLHYKAPGQQLINIRYNYQRDLIEDIDLSFHWRFDHRFSLLGKWQHSLLHQRDLNHIIGLEYGGRCCWKLRSLYQRFVNETDINQNIDQEADTRFMLQLELRGLGALGEDIQQTLEEFIYGYQAEQ